MRKVLSTLLSVFVLGAIPFNIFAVPAKPGVLTLRQADGSELRGRLYGDERSHYRTTEDGYLLVSEGGNYFYAAMDNGNVVNSGVRARDINLRTAADRSFLGSLDAGAMIDSYRETAMLSAMRAQGPGLFPGTSFPATGVQKALVILVEYSDVKFKTPNAYDYFNRLLNEKGFSDYGGEGSARDWYIDASNGRFQPDFDVFGPVTLSHSRAYYGANNSNGDDVRPEEMIIEACQLLSQKGGVNFSDYDRDHDGYIDNVFVFYAGEGEATGGSEDCIWPHSWDVTSATDKPYLFNGVRLDRYACSNEWTGGPDGIGTFCHEFGHVMGLPDIYATSYSGAFTPEAWDVMDAGSYNNDSRTPPTFTAFERYALGWIDPVVIDGPANCSLNHILDSNEAYIIKTDDVNEYFLLENRQQKGWDRYVPGHGMLVWHIDYDPDVWTYNTCNNDSRHQHVDLEEADGSQTESSRSGDAFPGSRNITSFTDDTRPSMRTWANKALNLPITDIAEDSKGVVTFKVAGGVESLVAPVINDEILNLSYNTATVTWSSVSGAKSYLLSLRNGDNVVMDRVDVGNVTEYVLNDLTPLTTYTVTVSATNSEFESEVSSPVTFTTLDRTFSNMRPELEAPADITADGVTLKWLPVDGAEGYLLSLYTKSYVNPVTDVVNGSYATLPEGWHTTVSAVYTSNGYYGESSPALKFDSDGVYLESPEYDKDIESLKFWSRGATAHSDNSLSVLAQVNGNWVTVGEYSLENAKGGKNIEITSFPANSRKIRIVYNKKRSGNLAIDDVRLSWGGDDVVAFVEPYRDFSVGNVLSYGVGNLTPETSYYYTVQAASGTERSLPSREGSFVTTVSSGIPAVTGDDVRLNVAVSGLMLTVTSAPGSHIVVTDVAGRTVASVLSKGDNMSLLLPAPDLYIVRGEAEAVKIIVR